ncbi:rRNA adenine N-6-methyltransferase family protein [Streptomyces bluensis]|uniref:rRNA adenine N-6-methyltransferase family protein n=1 Tax=Streptomyces bluensis TaxID=33897 RepID=UPI003EBC6A3B
MLVPLATGRTIEELELEDSHTALEIGTGTGYSSALVCHRLGEDNVTSVEIDEQVAALRTMHSKRPVSPPGLWPGTGCANIPAGRHTTV